MSAGIRRDFESNAAVRQLPPELAWGKTFLVARSNRSKYFPNKSAPAALRTVRSQNSPRSSHAMESVPRQTTPCQMLPPVAAAIEAQTPPPLDDCAAAIEAQMPPPLDDCQMAIEAQLPPVVDDSAALDIDAPIDSAPTHMPRTSIGTGESNKLWSVSEDGPSADDFGIGDTVAATADFRISGVPSIEKGCKGIVVCHGERPDGSMGVSVQFEPWKDGGEVNVLCQPHEIQVVAKAPSAYSFGIGDVVAATATFRIGGVLAVEKGSRGTVVCHGERPDGVVGISIMFEARKDGRDANVLCQPHEIQVVMKAVNAHWMRKSVQWVREYVTLLACRFDSVLANARSSVISFQEMISSSPLHRAYENFAKQSFSSRTWAFAPILLGIFAICILCLLLPSIPASEKVFIQGTEVYSQTVGHTRLNQCASFVHSHVRDKGNASVMVCGTQTKVVVFLRNKCEVYSTYQHEIGSCNATEASNTCVTAGPATEKGVRWQTQVQSYRIEQCEPSNGFLDTLGQHLLRIRGICSPMPIERSDLWRYLLLLFASLVGAGLAIAADMGLFVKAT